MARAATPPAFVGPSRSLSERTRLWMVAGVVIWHNPLLGVGRDNWYPSYPFYFWRVDPNLSGSPRGAHSAPLEIAAETGLPGLAAFVATLGSAVWGLRAAKRHFARASQPRQALLLEGLELAIYGYLVTSLFLNDNYTRWLWLLVALAIVGRQLVRHDAARTSR